MSTEEYQDRVTFSSWQREVAEEAPFAAHALYWYTFETTAIQRTRHRILKAGDRVVVLGDLNDEEPTTTTQILNDPNGSEIGTPDFHQPDNGDALRLWNFAQCIPVKERYSQVPWTRRAHRPHLRQPRPL